MTGLQAPPIANLLNLQAFFHYFDQQGIAWRAVAQQCQIPVSTGTNQWVTLSQTQRFFQSLPEARSRALGAEAGLQADLAMLAPPLMGAGGTMTDLATAIQALLRYLPHLSSHVQIWPEAASDGWRLCHRGQLRPTSPGVEQMEWFRVAALIRYCQRVLGEGWWPDWLALSGPAPAYALPAPLRKIPQIYLQPVASFPISLPQAFVPLPQPDGPTPLARLQALADTYACYPGFTLPWFAALLGVSVRSLQRQLATVGISFRSLRDQARYGQARRLLAIGDLAMEEVAWRCGYGDIANFNRAFIGWAGVRPARYRLAHAVTDQH